MKQQIVKRKIVAEPVVRVDPASPLMEYFKTIRTNIEFSSIDNKLRTVNITSSNQGEGKSLVLVNLALSFAQIGRKVLIIDADLRRPSIHRYFGISNRHGLTNALLGRDELGANVMPANFENLSILTSGPIPPNPAELLMSETMTHLIEKVREMYDMVFIDCPPAGIITDAAIVATKVDGTLFVARSGVADKRLVKQAVEHLKHVNARVLGFVFNGIEQDTDDYYYHQYYYSAGSNRKGKNSRSSRKNSSGLVRKVDPGDSPNHRYE